MKILFIINNLCIGGAEKFVLSISKSLRKKGYKIIVFSLFKNNILKSEFQEAGVKVKLLLMNRKSISGFIRLIRSIRSERPDIVHTHLDDAHIYGCIAAKIAGVPVIIFTIHSTGWWLFGGGIHQKMRRFADRFTGRLCDNIIAVSSHVKENLIKYGKISGDKIIVNRNGIMLRKNIVRLSSSNKNTPIIATVGRLVKEKGIVYFLHAAKDIIVCNKKVKFWIVGDGYLRKNLEKISESMELSSYVDFLGFRDDVYKLLSRIDIFVLSSVSEGLPISLLEAMSMRKPVVVTKISGIKEVVIHNHNGIIVEPKNPQEIASACLHLLNFPKRAKEIGYNAQKTVEEKFDIEQNVDKTIALYKNVLKRKGYLKE